MSTKKETIHHDLKAKGFTKIEYSPNSNIADYFESLGEVIFKTEIKENPSSTRLLASNNKMELHTDHQKARYIAWFCNSQSASGGESLLLDSFQVIRNFSDETLNLLSEITIKSHNVFYGDKLSYPLLSLNDNKKAESIYYAQWLVNAPGCIKHKKALEKFENLIEYTEPNKVLLSEGDLLIIDNHRMLHGREGFPSASNRWLTRYWLSDNTNQKTNK
ncbi:MAG: TauD/TfdA family dioxygenase [Bacteroidia bacterium]|nr:TauD/TfdA family dioxygenase [Bacteroidia bacterium]